MNGVDEWCRIRARSDGRSRSRRAGSDGVLDEVLADIRTDIACLFRCSEAIAMLDMLAR